MKQRVVLGRVVEHHGLKGWVKVFSFTEPRSRLFEYAALNIGDCLNLAFDSQVKGKLWMLKAEGFDSREASESFVGQDIWLSRDDMPALEPGEYYWHDLEGCSVVDSAGVTLGVVDRIMATGANDVLVVRGATEILIPFVQPQVVTEVDLDASCITVDWDPADI